MIDKVMVGPVCVSRGSKAAGFLEVCTMAAGGPLRLPVHVIAGSSPGPHLCLMAGQHGDEIRSIWVIKKVLDDLHPEEVSGSVVAVPVANPIAFEGGVRCTWMDGVHGDGGNLNRVWPGSPDGWITERIANVLWREVISNADCVLDLHGDAFDPGISIYYAYLGDQSNSEYSSRCRQLALNFGMELLVRHSEPMSGMPLSSHLATAGIYLVACELGDYYGLRSLNDDPQRKHPLRDVLEVGVTGVINVMKAMGMLRGSPSLPARQVIVSTEVGLKPSHGGLLCAHVGKEDVGRVVSKETVLGTVVSPYTFEELDRITAPFEETIIIAVRGVHGLSRVNPGDYAFYVADWQTAEWVSPEVSSP